MSLRISARSWSARSDSAMLSGTLHVSHMTSSSTSLNDARGCAPSAARRREGERQQGQQRDHGCAHQSACARSMACDRKSGETSPRDIATTWPALSMTKVSGSFVVPYLGARSSRSSRRLG